MQKECYADADHVHAKNQSKEQMMMLCCVCVSCIISFTLHVMMMMIVSSLHALPFLSSFTITSRHMRGIRRREPTNKFKKEE